MRLLACTVILVFALAGCRDDGSGGTGPQNQAPSLQAPESVDAVVGVESSFGFTASDPDGDELTLLVTPVLSVSEFRGGVKPGPVELDAVSGTVSFTPNVYDVPQRILKIIARDTSGAATEADVLVMVAEPPSR